jgi:hypothetical protein
MIRADADADAAPTPTAGDRLTDLLSEAKSASEDIIVLGPCGVPGDRYGR